MRQITEQERYEALAHPARFLELALQHAPEQQVIKLDTNEAATYFFKRLSASNKAKRFRPRNIWCTRDKEWVYAKAPPPLTVEGVKAIRDHLSKTHKLREA